MAKDVIAVVVHPDNPVKELALEQLSKIFTGKSLRWNDLGGADEKILALYQPVAIDLRFIITALKINNDQERIGDLAVNLAEHSIFLASHLQTDVPFDFDEMTEKTELMLRKSLGALVKMDSKLVYEVCAADDEIDAMDRQMQLMMQNAVHKHPEQTECLMHLRSTSGHLERVADHTTNIAEDVIYMIESRIVRRKAKDYKS